MNVTITWVDGGFRSSYFGVAGYKFLPDIGLLELDMSDGDMNYCNIASVKEIEVRDEVTDQQV